MGRGKRKSGPLRVRDLTGRVRSGYSPRRGRITVRILDAIESTQNVYVLFEGNAAALDLVGRLFIAQARTKAGCAYDIGPIGPGGGMFADDSTLGIYIHRLPCEEVKGYRVAKDRAQPIGRILKKLETRHRLSSTRRRIELRRGHGKVKFSALYRQALRFWPSRIDVSDGRPVVAGDGTVGYLFPRLSEAYSRAETRSEEDSDLVGMMHWTVFQELHEVARRMLAQKRKWLQVADLDKRSLALQLVRNLNTRGWTLGWRQLRDEFLRTNPGLRPSKNPKR